ncbi:BspA family leucine-rich repeat surface protein [Arenicellales bacterium nBUS_45]
MTLLIRLLSVLVISTSLFVAGCSSGGSSAGLEKDDTDGDGIADIYDPDIDGDGIPNGQDPDIDGDGIPNDQDPDMDGDGKPNGKDPDPENNDPNYCDRIQVFGLNEEQTTGSEIELTWKLTSKTGGDCVVKDGVAGAMTREHASAVGATTTDSEPTNPLVNARAKIKIPEACTGETVEVTYDFTEIATLIKADPNAPGWKVTQRHRADPDRCDLDGDDLPDFGLAACLMNDEDIKNAVNDYITGGGNGNYVEDSKFANCGLIGTWDVSQVTNMKSLFEGKSNFNEDISNWNVSNVTDMQQMFICAGFNQDISGWDVSNVTSMVGMFAQLCGVREYHFNQDISRWDVSNVRDIAFMFQHNEVFNQPLGAWDVSSVESDREMFAMFDGASSFDQDLSGWCVRNIDSEPQHFDKNSAFEGQTTKQPNWGTCGEPRPSDETASASDTDNDGIPNDADPDVDGDGTPNTSDNDIDGDGIWNKDDPDIDGDGKTNGIDPDADGDGTPDAEDDTPGGPQ